MPLFGCSPYVIGTMNQTSSTCPADLQVHHNFRWVLYANHIEPVRSFLGRYLRRQLASRTGKSTADAPGPGSSLMVVERVVDWLPKVWQRINRFLESQSNFDITLGLTTICFFLSSGVINFVNRTSWGNFLTYKSSRNC